jgi:hypothetical protein
MAAAHISKPGSVYGPCLDACKHSDCDAWRRMAESTCRLCSRKIGYETRFYQDPQNENAMVHAICLEKRLSPLRAQAGS